MFARQTRNRSEEPLAGAFRFPAPACAYFPISSAILAFNSSAILALKVP